MATIVTVHGTGASGPEHGDRWWQKGSPFEKHLRALIESEDGQLKYEPMVWDGANSETSRRAAGRKLTQKCEELEQANENYCVIGHSHGGSVISAALCMAANKRQILPRLQKWITIGTPFLVAKKRRLLFNRLNFWEKSIYVLFLTACLFLTVGAFGTFVPQPSPSNAIIKFIAYTIAGVVAFGPAILALSALWYASSRRCFSGNRRLTRRFRETFSSRWNPFFHQDDEAIRGLYIAQTAKFPIFRRFFLLPYMSVFTLVLFPIALLSVSASEGLMLQLSAQEDKQYLPAFMVENGQLKGAGRNIAANVALVFEAPIVLAKQSGLWPPSLTALTERTPFFLRLAIYMTIYMTIFYLPSLIIVLLVIGIGALMSAGLSRLLDGITWRQLRASAFGDDDVSETIIGSEPRPMWIAADMPALPAELSAEISVFSDQQAAQSIARLRSALNVFAFANGDREKSDMLSRYLTWDELIHTSYFQIPRFRKLVAYAIATAEGFQATEQFRRDRDYAVVKGWFDELQRKDKTEMVVPASTAGSLPASGSGTRT